MPRLPKAESEKYQAGLAVWTPRVLAVIQELAETVDNKVKRSEIVTALGDDFEERFINPIFSSLFAAGHITKTGSARGRGARWGVPSDAPSELVVSQLSTGTVKPPMPRMIRVTGQYANLAAAYLRARVPKVGVAIVEQNEDSDYTADTGNTREIKHWFEVFMRRFA